MTPSQLATTSGTPAREIVRLEGLAEQVIRAGGSAEGFAADFAAALDAAVSAAPGRPAAAGLKSIAAYRYGLDFDPARRPRPRSPPRPGAGSRRSTPTLMPG